jgi:hypothetical protein
MIRKVKILFIPHEHNNHKPKFLHLSSLFILVLLIISFQLFVSFFHRIKPGVLGFASNIKVETIVADTNLNRTKEGLNSLQLNSTLSEAARQKANDMFSENYWAHFSPKGKSPWEFFKSVGYNYLYAGENLARDFSDSDAVVQAWMNSPSHKDNIMNAKYRDIGVAVVNGLLDGEETTLVVQLFGTTGGVAAIPDQGMTKTNEVVLSQQSQVFAFTPSPVFSGFNLTKSLNLSILLLLLVVLLIDVIFVFKKKLVRLSGKSFIHFSFLAIIFIVVFLTASGQVI